VEKFKKPANWINMDSAGPTKKNLDIQIDYPQQDS